MISKIKNIIKNLFFNLGLDIKKIKIKKKKLEIVSPNQINFYKKKELQEVCNQIYKFLDKIDLFYSGLDLIEPLKIKGAWKGELISRRKIQNKIYEDRNNDLIIQFHENMFFNECTKGLWNYSYIEDIENISLNKFYNDYFNFKKIFDYPKIISSDLPFKRWGIRLESNFLIFNDLWHTEQAVHIKNIYNFFKKKSEICFLEIGSGYGGMIEKLEKFKIFKKYFLIDIPHNLITTYYFLSKIYGKEQVCLVDNRNFTSLINNTKIKFFLIPTCFFEEIKNIHINFILSNSGSFSEMNKETIDFYIKNLPSKTLGIMSINSNENSINTLNYIEVKSDDINFQNYNLVYEGFPISSTTNRYKTKILFNRNYLS
tara:strand:+ start:5446 stop:6558 length:1113 start_codon:yes stop_codon:yes gene_type:complete